MFRIKTIGAFSFYVLPTLEYVAREDLTGIAKPIRIAPAMGGFYELASDSRFVAIAGDCGQGKHGSDELVVAVFDVQAKTWKNFSNQPQQNLFHGINSLANPNWLWIKNGGQVSGYPRDPGTSIGNYRFLSTSEIEWVTSEHGSNELDASYKRWRRMFDPATGALQLIREITPAFIVNPADHKTPEWYDHAV